MRPAFALMLSAGFAAGIQTAHSQAPAIPCSGQVYSGFDSRLRPSLVGRLPQNTGDVIGLEIAGDQVFAATNQKIYLFEPGKQPVVTSPGQPIRGIATDVRSNLLVQTDSAVHVLSATDQSPAWSGSNVSGRVVGSGADSWLEMTQEADATVLAVRRRSDFAARTLAKLQGTVGPVTWTAAGFAGIIDKSIVNLDLRNPRLTVVESDEGFARARDLAVLTDSRYVVALQKTVVLASSRARLILAGVTARVRGVGRDLVLLDEDSGVIWRLAGFEALGDETRDRVHAETLLATYRTTGDRRAALEAARIIGCKAIK